MSKNNIKTSTRVSSKASDALKDSQSKKGQSVACSALSNAKSDTKKKSGK